MKKNTEEMSLLSAINTHLPNGQRDLEEGKPLADVLKEALLVIWKCQIREDEATKTIRNAAIIEIGEDLSGIY